MKTGMMSVLLLAFLFSVAMGKYPTSICLGLFSVNTINNSIHRTAYDKSFFIRSPVCG